MLRYSYANVIDGIGIATVEPGFRVPSGDPGLGIHAIEPGYAVPASQLGGHVVQDATIVDPRTGWPPPPMPGQGLGLITETDAWMTGRTAGLPGTATMQYVQQPDGSYASRMLGATVVEPGFVVPANGLGLVSNEIQRTLGDSTFDLGIFGKPTGQLMLGVIGAVTLIGIIGAIVSATPDDAY